MILLGTAAATVDARTLRVAGTAGYLSEWEFKGELSQRAPGKGDDYSGSVTWILRRIVQCERPANETGRNQDAAVDGRPDPDRRNHFVRGRTVRLSGGFSGGSSGYMDCPNAKGVALSISVQ